MQGARSHHNEAPLVAERRDVYAVGEDVREHAAEGGIHRRVHVPARGQVACSRLRDEDAVWRELVEASAVKLLRVQCEGWATLQGVSQVEYDHVPRPVSLNVRFRIREHELSTRVVEGALVVRGQVLLA